MYNENTEETRDINTTSSEWGKYWISHSTDFRFTSSSEFYKGNFGDYFPNSGYVQDFYPYDETKSAYLQTLA